MIGSASVYSEKAIESNSGRSEGGLACLWQKDSHFTVDRIITTTNYIVTSVRFGSLTLVMVNVYLRSDIWEVRTLNAYLDALSELENIVNSMRFDSIYLVGDPFTGRAWGNLVNFIERNNLKCFDKELMDDDSFTFVSYGNGATKWLDHILGRESNNFNHQAPDGVYKPPLVYCRMGFLNTLPFSALHLSKNEALKINDQRMAKRY